MDSKITIAAKFSEQDPEAFALLENILARPGIYVGAARFDLVNHFLCGYSMGHSSNECEWFQWFPYELQYWLLHTVGIIA